MRRKPSLWIAFPVLFACLDGSSTCHAHTSDLVRVSFTNLIATPERFNGRVVSTAAYVSIRLENMSLCSNKHPLSEKQCIWLNIDSGPYETDQDIRRFKAKEKMWKQFDGQVISLRGTFDQNDTGHLGMWAGAIKDVTEVSGKVGKVRKTLKYVYDRKTHELIRAK